MAVTWTKEQQQVIDLRDRNILVSAAAGSGKTAVLVERILTMITDEKKPVDIDSLLIVTFTRAAASEMKERIRAAIEKRLEVEPDNEHLQRQSTLIHNAQINTIDGFCSYIIRNYFHMIDLDPGFRTGDEGELRLMKNDVMKEVIEEAYQKAEPDFLDFVECYATGKSDENIAKQALSLFEYSMSYPWPKEWLMDCKSSYNIFSVEEMMETPWMFFLMDETRRVLKDCEEMAEYLLELCRQEDGPYMYEDALKQDLGMILRLQGICEFDEYVECFSRMKFARLSAKRDINVSDRLRDQVKDGRNEMKETLNKLKESYFYMSAKEILESIRRCRVPVCALIDLALEFGEAYSRKKREKNLVDFADMEHFALEILVQKDGEQLIYSQAAKDFSQRFEEIFIDEYQDSNLVQETLLTAVSRLPQGKYNIFMVGDVKQSIYRFRMARPELFMEKFHSYSTSDSKTQRIDLHKNFRSRPQVLAGVNYMFYQIMGEELGKVEYDDEAALYPGASFPEGNEEAFATTELILVQQDGEGLEEEKGLRMNQEIEALAVAERIRNIVGKELVLDKETGSYRPTKYGDIVILLRTMSGWSEVFGQVLAGQGIPSYSASKSGYFLALEVVTVLNYLHILDNPCQDIPLGAILHSPIGGCSSEEMAKIRAYDKTGNLYDSVQIYLREGPDECLRHKLQDFWTQYESLRSRVPYTPIHELIIRMLKETGYSLYAASMPAGEQREANLRMLVEKAMEFEQTSYRGLFNFIRYIEHLRRYDVDFGEVNISGGGDDVVQIMSIHKSKGLEFPIVFVSGLGKQFNQQDVNASLVVHQDLGIGADCIYPEDRIKFKTVMKQVIRHQTKLENMGEELRVLYVAMTRAKEKLILTSTVSNLENVVLKCQRISKREQTKLPYETLSRAARYLDWVLPALARHPAFLWLYYNYGVTEEVSGGPDTDQVPISIQVVTPMELLASQVEKQVQQQIDREVLKRWDTSIVYEKNIRSQLERRFSFQYPYEYLKNIPVKVSVSELKRQSLPQEEDSLKLYEEPEVEELVPAFMKDSQEEYVGAARGTAYHRMLECLDLTRASSLGEIRGQIEELVASGKMDEKMASCIWMKDILQFASSSLGRRMAKAQQEGLVFREQPFVLSQNASAVNESWGEKESVLVQGIIDAYFLEDGEIVLVDYKTDRVSKPEELTERYHLQLSYYADALRRLTGKKVKEKIIYSFALGQEILLPDEK